MANSKNLHLYLFLTLATILSSQVQSQTPSPEPAGPTNLTAILEKNGQFSTFLRLLRDTQVGNQIQNQLNSSGNGNGNGLTVLAPTDNAFNNLKAGTLNDLTNQQQVQLVLYHVIPQFLSFANLQTVSNPVRTQATGSDGVWGLRISAQNNQVNVSTGVVETQVYNPLWQESPLAVYQVDKVLLPEELFGTNKASAPEAPTKSSDEPKAPKAEANSTEPASSPEGTLLGSGNNSGSSKSTTAGLGLVLGVGVMAFVFS